MAGYHPTPTDVAYVDGHAMSHGEAAAYYKHKEVLAKKQKDLEERTGKIMAEQAALRAIPRSAWDRNADAQRNMTNNWIAAGRASAAGQTFAPTPSGSVGIGASGSGRLGAMAPVTPAAPQMPTTGRRGMAGPVSPTPAGAHSPTGARINMLHDPENKRAPVVVSVEPMTSQPGSLRAAGVEGGYGQPQSAANPMAGAEDMGAFADQAAAFRGADPLEQLRIQALDQILQRWKAEGGQMFYQPGTGNDPYMPGGSRNADAARGYNGHPYSGAQVQNNDGSAAGPITTPGEANGGRGQMTADAIGAYILSQWHDDPGGAGNMSQDNINFLLGLR